MKLDAENGWQNRGAYLLIPKDEVTPRPGLKLKYKNICRINAFAVKLLTHFQRN